MTMPSDQSTIETGHVLDQPKRTTEAAKPKRKKLRNTDTQQPIEVGHALIEVTPHVPCGVGDA